MGLLFTLLLNLFFTFGHWHFVMLIKPILNIFFGFCGVCGDGNVYEMAHSTWRQHKHQRNKQNKKVQQKNKKQK